MITLLHPGIPVKALSIRQPWAWAILNAGKDIENRPRRTHYRGRVAIHASLYNNFEDWKYASEAIKQASGYNISVPYPAALERGGIVGTVEIVDCVDQSDSPWFFGEYGYILRDPKPCTFIPVKGALGLFDWRKNLKPEYDL